jgi:hypothetical protein
VNPPASIIDIGCGTGAAGAAWAMAAGGSPFIRGLDRSAWAVDEARRTYRELQLRGQAKQADVARLPKLGPRDAVISAYTLNELPPEKREVVEHQLLESAAAGTSILIIEPISRGVTPWWTATARRFEAVGGRADEWRFALDRPRLIELFDSAAGLDHREVTARTVYVPARENAVMSSIEGDRPDMNSTPGVR